MALSCRIQSRSGHGRPGVPPVCRCTAEHLCRSGRRRRILHAFEAQLADTLALLHRFERRSRPIHHAPAKWTIKEVLGHVIDTERILAYRALCIARGDTTALPDFEQDDYIEGANFNAMPLEVLLQEFRTVRQATLSLFLSCLQRLGLARDRQRLQRHCARDWPSFRRTRTPSREDPARAVPGLKAPCEISCPLRIPT